MITRSKFETYRVRVRTGHAIRLRKLYKKEHLTSKELQEIRSLKKLLDNGKGGMLDPSRSLNVFHYWQALSVEKSFKKAKSLEAEGKSVPKELVDIDICPRKDDYLEEIAYILAAVSGMNADIVKQMEEDLFFSQGDVNPDWLVSLRVDFGSVRELAINICNSEDEKTIVFKNKKFLFIGAPQTITSSKSFLQCLMVLGKAQKIDGIITTGNWIKTIFHNTKSKYVEIPKELKDLIKEFPFYAVRANKDGVSRVKTLKSLGVKFIRDIEREHFHITGLKLHYSSSKDQLKRLEYKAPGKDLLCNTTYVGIRSQATKGVEARFIIGSGSSGVNTPHSRYWASAYDSQLFNADARDSIGGHVIAFDEEERLYTTTFRYEREHKAIFYDGKIYKESSVAKANLHVILTDLHVLSNSASGFSAFLNYIRKNKKRIKTLVLNGDFFSNHALNHYLGGQIKKQVDMKKEGIDFLKEIALVRVFLDKIDSVLSPKTTKVFKIGNHEKNSLDSFLSKDLNHMLDRMLELDALLGLTKKKYKIIPNNEIYDLYDITITHGNEMKPTEVRKLAGKKVVRGHSHLLDIGTDGVTLPGMEDPTKADYLPTRYVKWAIGFGVITEYKGCASLPHPVLIRYNRYYDFNKISDIKEEKIKTPKKIILEYSLE